MWIRRGDSASSFHVLACCRLRHALHARCRSDARCSRVLPSAPCSSCSLPLGCSMLSCSLPLGCSMLSCSLPLGCSILFMLAAARMLDSLHARCRLRRASSSPEATSRPGFPCLLPLRAASRSDLSCQALHARYRLHEHPRRPKPHLGRAFLACCRSAPLPRRIFRAKLFHAPAVPSFLARGSGCSSFFVLRSRPASLAAYSSALRSSFTLPLSLRSSLAACLSALRASLALPLSHLWTYLCASTDCSAARAGLPSLFFRVRRAAVDAHGAYATLWTRTGPMLHSPPFTSCQFTGCGSLSRAAARGASWRGCTARTLCSGSLLLRGGAGLLAGVLFSFQAVYFLVTSRRFRGSPLTRSSCRSRLPAARCLSHPSLNFRFFFDLRCEMPLWVLFSPVPRFSPGFRFSGGRPAAIWLLNRPGPPWDWNPRARLGTETSLVKGTF